MRVYDKDLVQLDIDDFEWFGYESCAHSKSKFDIHSDEVRIIPRVILDNPECYASRDRLTLILGMES